MFTFYRHEVIDVHRTALAALANLSWHSEIGRQAIVDAGAIPEVVRLLSSFDSRVLEYSSKVLHNIAVQDSFRASVVEAGSARPLVQLLQCVSVSMRNSGCLPFTGTKSLMFTTQHLLRSPNLVVIPRLDDRQLLPLAHSQNFSPCLSLLVIKFANILTAIHNLPGTGCS
jgi:hypothetical protein